MAGGERPPGHLPRPKRQDDRPPAGALCRAVAFYSLIHLLRSELPAAVAECARVLAPGAPLLVAVHGGEGHLQVEEMLGEPVPMYATLYRQSEIVQQLERSGFRVEDAITRPPYPFEHPTPRVYVTAVRGP